MVLDINHNLYFLCYFWDLPESLCDTFIVGYIFYYSEWRQLSYEPYKSKKLPSGYCLHQTW